MKTTASTIVFLLLFLPFLGQEEVFHAYTIDDGLPENTSNALIQDHIGRIWIGTQAGVAIYDGARFYSIGAGPEEVGLTNNMVEGLFEDNNHNIWVSTRNGLNKISPDNTIKHFFLDSLTPYGKNFLENSFYEDEQFIWFATRGIIYQLNKQDESIHAVFEFGRSAMTRIGNFNNDLYCSFDSALFQIKDYKLSDPIQFNSKILSINEVKGELWIATYDGIYNLENKLLFDELKNIPVIYTFATETEAWIGTSKGIFRFDFETKKMHQIQSSSENGLANNLQLAILKDSHNNLWFGTGAGLHIYNPESEKINRVGRKKGIFQLENEVVNSIAYSPQQQLVAIGTEKGLHLSKIKETSTAFNVESEITVLPEESINFVKNTVDGAIWIGTKSGKIYRYYEQLQELKTEEQLFGIRGFLQNPIDSSIWVATSRGIYYIQYNVLSQPEWVKEITYTVALIPFENGFLVSHSDKIYQVDWNNNKLALLEANNTTPGFMLTESYKTDSALWLSSISEGVFNYSIKDSLFAEYKILDKKNAWSIFGDQQGRMWSNTDDGLLLHNGKKILLKLTEINGINYNDFSMTAQCQLLNKTLIYGNKKGLSIVYPDKINLEEWNATPYLSELEINYKQRSLSELKDQLVLLPKEKSIKFHVGLSDFVRSEFAQISFRLLNFEDNWSTYTSIKEPLNFTGLPAGEYTLEVRVKDNSDRVSKQILSQQIQVLPYFYETWWFKTIILILIGVLLYLIASYRAIQKQKAAERKLATEKALSHERERISRDLHDSIGAQLTKIVSDLDIMELKADIKGEPIKVEDINKTREFTLGTISNLRETIWTLDIKVVTIADLHHQLKKYLERYLPENLNWELKFDHNILIDQLSPSVAVNLFRILQEMTQNMLKYSGADQFIITFSKEKNYLITTFDNGKGFDWESTSKGEGLKNMQLRVVEIGGEITHSNANGSLFTIRF